MSHFTQTTVFLVCWFLAMVAWDVHARLNLADGSTVSEVLWWWARYEPATVALVFFLLGHVYFPQQVRP